MIEYWRYGYKLCNWLAAVVLCNLRLLGLSIAGLGVADSLTVPGRAIIIHRLQSTSLKVGAKARKQVATDLCKMKTMSII